jgi:hypothetical protein
LLPSLLNRWKELRSKWSVESVISTEQPAHNSTWESYNLRLLYQQTTERGRFGTLIHHFAQSSTREREQTLVIQNSEGFLTK